MEPKTDDTAGVIKLPVRYDEDRAAIYDAQEHYVAEVDVWHTTTYSDEERESLRTKLGNRLVAALNRDGSWVAVRDVAVRELLHKLVLTQDNCGFTFLCAAYEAGFEAGRVAEWIPCETRLPTERKWYEVTIKEARTLERLVTKMAWSGSWRKAPTVTVVAWRELPYPYQSPPTSDICECGHKDAQHTKMLEGFGRPCVCVCDSSPCPCTDFKPPSCQTCGHRRDEHLATNTACAHIPEADGTRCLCDKFQAEIEGEAK